MVKKQSNGLNLFFGIVSGLVVGTIFMVLWNYLPLFAPMLYLIVLMQTEVIPKIGEAYGVNAEFIVGLFHFLTSIVLGILFALIFKKTVNTLGKGMIYGAVFGFVWWVLTPFYLLPFFLVADPSIWWSHFKLMQLLNALFSHIFFGFLLGFFYSLLKKLGKPRGSANG
ncbi:MAG: hypothetical protein H7A38_04015 [Chlamydiales bacterium]|nr:hypothetical protein [Chlamydiales bacterium]